jgi:hypothetical protein
MRNRMTTAGDVMTTVLMIACVGAVILGGTILGWMARAHLSGVDLAQIDRDSGGSNTGS